MRTSRCRVLACWLILLTASLAHDALAQSSLTRIELPDKAVGFGGAPYCSYQVGFSGASISFAVIRGASGEITKLSNLLIQATAKETGLNGCSFAPFPTAVQTYSVREIGISGGRFSASLPGAGANSPASAAKVSGTISTDRTRISLAVTLQRTDQPGTNLNWVAEWTDLTADVTPDAFTLEVRSDGVTSVPIGGKCGPSGTTPYSTNRTYLECVDLTAPIDAGGAIFSHWSGCSSVYGDQGRHCLLYGEPRDGATRTVTANYKSASTTGATIHVKSAGTAGVAIASPSGYGGTTDYSIPGVPWGSLISLTAPAIAASGSKFTGWSGCDSVAGDTGTVCNLRVPVIYCITTPCPQIQEMAVTATYSAISRFNVKSSGAAKVPITSSTGHGGSTDYTLTGLAGGVVIELTAPLRTSDAHFTGWKGCDAVTGPDGTTCRRVTPYCKACASEICPAVCLPDWEDTVTASFATLAPTKIQADCLFNWGEDNHPSLFQPPRPTSVASDATYYFRHYSITNAYLGVDTGTSPHLYFVAPGTGVARVQDLGPAADWITKAGCGNP